MEDSGLSHRAIAKQLRVTQPAITQALGVGYPGLKVMTGLASAFPEESEAMFGLASREEVASAPEPDAPTRATATADRGSTAVEYPDRYPNRVEAMRAFAMVYRCSEEEVQRVSQVAAVALQSETDPSTEAWFKELERARAYLKRERRGHGHLGEREVEPEDV